ncbi:hypothetical protein IHE44_0003519 [Lamprotornis superbus]|uniref:Uncharacterized protein n=1 Tax=Lamprotornis superbus TaxID=245042 RepID=A0A835TYZ9_9PASS|nr:hypothetical protein IHE44_0003519 [Lamprotornis superbus]
MTEDSIWSGASWYNWNDDDEEEEDSIFALWQLTTDAGLNGAELYPDANSKDYMIASIAKACKLYLLVVNQRKPIDISWEVCSSMGMRKQSCGGSESRCQVTSHDGSSSVQGRDIQTSEVCENTKQKLQHVIHRHQSKILSEVSYQRKDKQNVFKTQRSITKAGICIAAVPGPDAQGVVADAEQEIRSLHAVPQAGGRLAGQLDGFQCFLEHISRDGNGDAKKHYLSRYGFKA